MSLGTAILNVAEAYLYFSTTGEGLIIIELSNTLGVSVIVVLAKWFGSSGMLNFTIISSLKEPISRS